MTRPLRTGEKPEQVSLRIPKDLAEKVDIFKDREGTDRSAIIIRALRYWINIDGNVTTDNEFINRLDTIQKDISYLKNAIEKMSCDFEKERAGYQEIISKQYSTIDILLNMAKNTNENLKSEKDSN